MMDRIDEYNSEYCQVRYQKEENIVLLTWKKFCCYDDYRTPASYALELLKKQKGSNLVIDARNGFEDEKEDVEWGFTYLLPNMAKTDCKSVVIIMDAVNDIEGEMDMWTKEFMKYFHVSRATSYEEASRIIHS
ncbi:hypothetical protein [Variimorphobacter saccharofermentans]|jgi:hypothetical protein